MLFALLRKAPATAGPAFRLNTANTRLTFGWNQWMRHFKEHYSNTLIVNYDERNLNFEFDLSLRVPCLRRLARIPDAQGGEGDDADCYRGESAVLSNIEERLKV